MSAGRSIERVLSLPFIALIWLYRLTLSPLLGGRCRFHPSCSAYALGAYRAHGPIRGSWLALRRLARCHPLGGSGMDPVPEAGQRPGEENRQAREPSIQADRTPDRS